jgi:hypothetical protein
MVPAAGATVVVAAAMAAVASVLCRLRYRPVTTPHASAMTSLLTTSSRTQPVVMSAVSSVCCVAPGSVVRVRNCFVDHLFDSTLTIDHNNKV